MPPLDPAGGGGDLRHRAAGRIVDEERRLARASAAVSTSLRRSSCETVPLRRRWPLTRATRAEQAVGQFERRHFQADEQHGNVLLVGDVLGDVHRERRFAHAGAGGQDHQLAVVQAAGLAVEVAKADSRSRRRRACRPCGRRAAPSRRSTTSRIDWTALSLRLSRIEKIFCSAWLSRCGGFLRFVVGVAEDFGRGVDQRAERRFLADDLGVVGGVGGVGHRVDDLAQVGRCRRSLRTRRPSSAGRPSSVGSIFLLASCRAHMCAKSLRWASS